jgi:transcriptional regulator with XRE-family HTH domain
MFPNLKLQIFLRGSHQNRLAKSVGIDETVLSKIIHGYRNPTEAQRKLLANFLQADEEWLFQRFETPRVGASADGLQPSATPGAADDGDL